MNQRPSRLSSLAGATLAALAFTVGAGAAANAQTAPSVSNAPPSYATRAVGERIRGTISAITGKYTMQVRDERGFIDNVQLHQGTIINPTGLTLQPGMPVTITGTNAGSAFAANRIDTPFTVAVVQPYPAFYGGWGWGWGWGPRFRGGFWW